MRSGHGMRADFEYAKSLTLVEVVARGVESADSESVYDVGTEVAFSNSRLLLFPLRVDPLPLLTVSLFWPPREMMDSDGSGWTVRCERRRLNGK